MANSFTRMQPYCFVTDYYLPKKHSKIINLYPFAPLTWRSPNPTCPPYFWPSLRVVGPYLVPILPYTHPAQNYITRFSLSTTPLTLKASLLSLTTLDPTHYMACDMSLSSKYTFMSSHLYICATPITPISPHPVFRVQTDQKTHHLKHSFSQKFSYSHLNF